MFLQLNYAIFTEKEGIDLTQYDCSGWLTILERIVCCLSQILSQQIRMSVFRKRNIYFLNLTGLLYLHFLSSESIRFILQEYGFEFLLNSFFCVVVLPFSLGCLASLPIGAHLYLL